MHKPLSPIQHRARIRFTVTPPESGETPPAPAPGGGAQPPANQPPAEKTFTQAEVTAMMAREKREGAASAANKLAEELGVSLDEAKALIKKAKDADEASKSDAQKDRDAAAKEKQDAEADRAAAKAEVHQTRLERAFAKVGVDLTDDKEKAKNERLLRLVTAEVGASYEDVAAEVTQIQKDFPGLFGEEGKQPPKAPNGDPKGTPPKPNGAEDKLEAGRKRYEAKAATKADNPLTAHLNKS